MFPDFSALMKTGEDLTKQFNRIIELLETIERNTRPPIVYKSDMGELFCAALGGSTEDKSHG